MSSEGVSSKDVKDGKESSAGTADKDGFYAAMGSEGPVVETTNISKESSTNISKKSSPEKPASVEKEFDGCNFSLKLSIESGQELRSPDKMLTALIDRYYKKKKMYREAMDCYFDLNTFVFLLPIVLFNSASTIMAHVAATNTELGKTTVEYLNYTVMSLQAAALIWTSAQIKIGWVEKTRKAQSSMMNYRSLLHILQQIKLVIDSQKKKQYDGVIQAIEECYDEETKINRSDATVPICVYRKHNKEFKDKKDKDSDSFEQIIEGKSDKDTHVTKDTLDSIESMRINNAFLNATSLSDDNVDTLPLMAKLNEKYWRRKQMYYDAATTYWILSILCFYIPVILCQLTAIVAAVWFSTATKTCSLVIICANVLATFLIGIQAKIQWEKQLAKNEEAYHLYRMLESETKLRLLLLRQGVAIKGLVRFSWKCRDLEQRIMDSLPAVPKRTYNKWSGGDYFN